jgi:SAM-dependent methyltransferase
MAAKIMRPALCHFLAYLNRADVNHLEKTVLDCGAGGRYPPLALFYERGYTSYGIDISGRQIERAQTFCDEHGVQLTILKSDMRHIPFKDESFCLVYECDSMCHLTKKDIRITITEMNRVLKKGGYCSVGFMTLDSWPLDGEERGPGEFWNIYDGEEYVHSYFANDEPDSYFTDLEIVRKEKQTILYNEMIAQMSQKDWVDWYSDAWTLYSKAEWTSMYDERVQRFRSSALQYIVRKPIQ